MVRLLIGLAAAVMLGAPGAVQAAEPGTADLSLTKVAAQNTVREGGTVTYTVTVTNLGPELATGVVFGDPMPDQLNLVSSTCGDVSAFCTVDSLPVGGSATMTIVATTITNLARNERRISNTAFVAESQTPDSDPGNDQDSAIVRVVGPL
jgi:uncharacterized repeat protein (TIGR01451 family)